MAVQLAASAVQTESADHRRTGLRALSRTGAGLLFEVFSQRYEQGSILVATDLPFDEWTEVFGSERLPARCWDRLTHHVHIPEMNGESCRLKRSRETGPPIRQKNRTTHNASSMLPLPNSCKVATPTNLLLTVIRPVVHGYSATVACFVDALDMQGTQTGQPTGGQFLRQFSIELEGVINSATPTGSQECKG